MKLKKLIIGISCCSLLLLAGCSSNDSEAESGLILPEANYIFYSNDDLSIQYPRNWDVISKTELNSKFQANLEVAFRSNFKDLFFTPVITVEKLKTAADDSSLTFADNAISRNENSLIEYVLIDKQTISTLIGAKLVETSITKFRGKEKLQDDTLEYVQTYLTNDEIGFIVTAAYDSTDNKVEVEKIVNSLRTFKLK